MTNNPETVKEEDLIQRKDGLCYVKDAQVPFTGTSKQFHTNGQLVTKENYKNGELHGLFEDFLDNGQLKQKGHYKNGKKLGTWERFHKNGKLMHKINYKNGRKEGLFRDLWIFYPRIYNERKFLNGANGPFQIFNEKGQLIQSGIFRHGKLHGHCEFFDEEGNLTKTETWENGKLIE